MQMELVCYSLTTLVCITQIMELESARTEAQAEARSLAAELESLRSEEPADSSGVCHTHSPSSERFRSCLPSCASIKLNSCHGPQLQGPVRDRASRDRRVHHNHIPFIILALVSAHLAEIFHILLEDIRGCKKGCQAPVLP